MVINWTPTKKKAYMRALQIVNEATKLDMALRPTAPKEEDVMNLPGNSSTLNAQVDQTMEIDAHQQSVGVFEHL
jgi:hypothetical protein